MKNSVLFICMALLFGKSFGQVQDLTTFEKKRIQYTKNGMLVLGSWSAANLITGAIGAASTTGESHYFHQMNMYWGGINLVFAGLGYWGATKEKTTGLTITNVLNHQNKIAKTFLFNAGLDLAYVTAGFYLGEKSKRETVPAKLKGYGNSIIMQGAGLFLFDGILYMLHNKHGKQLNVFTDKITVLASPLGVQLSYKL
jgi:hypothetical protein